METLVLKNNSADIEKSIQILRCGGLVVFPTETVYGIGACAENDEAVRGIFKAKERPLDNPLIFHIGDVSLLDDLVLEVNENARKLMDKFWPGGLTLIFKKKPGVYDLATCGLDTIAVRLPDSEIAREILVGLGKPVVAPSANVSGRPSGTRFVDVFDDLEGRVEAIFDEDILEFGLESTVVDVSGEEVKLMRPGAVSLEEIEAVVGKVVVPENLNKKIADESEKIISPGMKYRHYTPRASVILFEGDDAGKLLEEFRKEKLSEESKVLTLEFATVEEASREMFAAFRRADREGIDYILVEAFCDEGLGLGLKNRLYKAASKIIS